MMQPLTFAALDGVAFAAQRGRLDPQLAVPLMSAAELGPLIEWSGLSVAGLLPNLEKTAWLRTAEHADLLAALRDGRRHWICPASRTRGLYRTPPAWREDDPDWIRFGLAAQRAAIAAGFHRHIAAKFVGGIGEMVSNIFEHSDAAESGIVVFRAADDAFEFVVADNGMGVLQSLQTCSEYRELSDHGTALRLALTDGISRFGRGAGRGNGFRPIFVGLANLGGFLRFRSGDHALVIDGQKIDLISARPAQKARIAGFCASVRCRLPP